MPYVVKDRVKVTSTTTGTGPFTLGAAATGFQSFAAISSGNAWNVASAEYIRSYKETQDAAPEGLFLKPDGTKMYIVGNSNNSVFEYNLSTPWNVSTASYLQSFSVATQETLPSDLFFKPDGLKMYVIGQVGIANDKVSEYDLSVAWDISTAVYLQNFTVAPQEANPTGLFFKPDGLKMYVCGQSGDAVYEYNLSSAWNVSTATYVQSFSVSAQDLTAEGLSFKTDGTKMYVLGASNDRVYEYNLSSAWNISTASFYQFLSIRSQDDSPSGIFFKPDGGEMYIVGSATDTVYEYNLGENQTYYCITNGTDWEIGLGSCSADGLTLSRDTVFESSNSDALVNWGAGSKTVFVTFPAEATEGSVPKGDTNAVGTDLVAWNNLKKQLNAGVINGVPYNNNNVTGIPSTYTLPFTANNAYFGGVLAPNGDIHFVPSRVPRGQKISATGAVSTYSLVYTLTTNIAYTGGVLAANGDIHFVPASAAVGQKINASGVVSTYSLVYTTTTAYAGGVLAPNGDIYFVPDDAAVGQKISAAGVVSTYSLPHTITNAYFGGVLAPNGDIHFIPRSARVGQKVSAAGVVSTYSLVYTTTLAYQGGVVAPNGDIHFVPHAAPVGQKVSVSGVVSTYPLAYTSSGAYRGGVLAPNGDIHFVPFDAAVGQKISSSGAVSTYSLAYTLSTGGAYQGGVLNQNGEIHFVPNNAQIAAIGQKISTNTARPIGYNLSPFFNKF